MTNRVESEWPKQPSQDVMWSFFGSMRGSQIILAAIDTKASVHWARRQQWWNTHEHFHPGRLTVGELVNLRWTLEFWPPSNEGAAVFRRRGEAK